MRSAAQCCALAALLLQPAPVRPQAPAAPPSPPAPVTLSASAAKSEVSVGETFAIEVAARGPEGTSYTFPAEASEERFEMRTPPAGQAGAPQPRPGTHRYEAAVFALGDVVIPPIPVRYRLRDGTEGEAQTQPIALKVVSLLPKDKEQQKLADIRGPAEVGIGRAFWLALGAATALLAAGAFWLLRRRRRATAPAAATAAPPAPPDVEALRALDALAASGLLGRGDYRPFYIQLTAVAKRYLERRLQAPVLEMTSAETVAYLRAHPHGAGFLGVVRDLAEAADRIKFAKGEGLAAEAERHLAAVRALVGALEAKLRPAPGEAGPPGAAGRERAA